MVAAVGLLVLVVIVALAAASFFPHMLAAVVTLLAVPAAVLLHALIGLFYTAFAIAAFAILVCLLQTITDTLALLSASARTNARTPQSLAARDAQTRRPKRSRIAA
jgi:hypothetical protein